jgi:hypothetical protein
MGGEIIGSSCGFFFGSSMEASYELTVPVEMLRSFSSL